VRNGQVVCPEGRLHLTLEHPESDEEGTASVSDEYSRPRRQEPLNDGIGHFNLLVGPFSDALSEC
jgi:hypothetical protein